MADLSSLIVRLEAETSQYNAAITKATEQISSFSDTVGSSIRDVAKDLLSLEALKQVFDFTDNIVKSMASFENLSHAVGVTTESLSQLSFAAKLSGVDDISSALEKMARSAGLAETGNAKLQGTFAALGVSLTDSSGKVKSSDQLFLDIADAVSKYNDGLAKTSAVQAIFGRSGAEYIAFLDQGAAAINAAKLEAIALGVDVSSSAAKAADEFEKDMVRIGAAGKGVFNKALEDVLPQFDALTKQIIAFAEETGNTDLYVEQLAAGFKVIGTVLVFVGTVFEAVGQTIASVLFSVVRETTAVADFLTTVWTDPIGAIKNYVGAQGEILSTYADVFKTIDAGGKAIEAIWDTKSINAWGIALDGAWDDIKKKPDLDLIDQTQIKAMEAAIDALAKLDDTLKQQVATYGLSGAAATVYDVTLGKLSASVAEVDKMNPVQAQQALAALEKQGKLSAASIDEINAAVAAGVPIGDAFKKSIIDEATALDQLKAVDLLSKLDSQLLTMTGHLEEASKAAFDLANRPLQVNIQTQQDKTTFSGLDNSQAAALAVSQLNDLNAQAITIEDALGKKIADVDAAGAAAGESNLQIAGEEAVARQGAISQLEALYVKAQALAEATGFASATEEAKMLQGAIGAIQFNPKIVDDVNALTEAQKKLLDVTAKEKVANDDLAQTMADLAKQNSQGALTDLDYMAKQDDARQKAIDQLTELEKAAKAVSDANPNNAEDLDKWKKLGVEITNLQTQMGQLAKTVRTDLTDDLTSAFVDFADGTKSAKSALQSFAADFEKQMLTLAAKDLFQKLFESTGISAGIDSLFGGATKAASGLAGSTAAATTISTAMTTAATAGATALGTGITTGTTAGATELGAGITTAATAAAAEMGTAITTAGTAAAAEMAAAIAGGSAAGSGVSAGTALAASAAAGGGPIPANQLTLVGEKGPELYVSDLGAQTAAAATKAGTAIPEDLTHAHVIGADGPEYIRPNASGFVVPSDVFLSALAERTAPQAPAPLAAGPDVRADVASPQGERQSAPDGGFPTISEVQATAPAIAQPSAAANRPESAAFPPPDAEAAAPTSATIGQIVPPVPRSDVGAAPTATDIERQGATGGVVGPLDQPLRIGEATSSFPDIRALAPVIDLSSLIAARLPAQQTRLFSPPETTAAERYPASNVIAFPAAAQGGPVYGGQTVYVGEQGPELLVSDSGGQRASSATSNGTQVPRDFASSQLIGVNGPAYLTPATDGFILPTDVFASQIPAQQQIGGASAFPNAASYTMNINGIDTPIGLTETFTTDAQGVTSIGENVNAYVGMILPAGTVTASGGTTITASDITYPPGNLSPDEFLGIYQAGSAAAQQQQMGVTLASYAAEFSNPPENSTPGSAAGYSQTGGGSVDSGGLAAPESPLASTAQFIGQLEKRATGGPVSAGKPYLVGETGPEFIVPATSGTVLPATTTAAALTAATAATVAATAKATTELSSPATKTDVEKAASDIKSHMDKEFKAEMIGSIIGALAPMIIGAVAGSSGSSIASLAAVAAFADGGPFTGGAPILVGENGPELIVPDASGTVIPNHAISQDYIRQLSNATAPSPQSVTGQSAAERSNVIAFPSPATSTASQLDQPTSAMIVKIENVIKQEQPMLSAHEYDALLTDRYLQKRASGGPVSAGKPYLVGENGPELMVPDSAGTVMNSWDDSQSNRSTVVHQYLNFTVNTPTGKVDRASQGQIAARTLMAAQMAGGRNN
jgi:hypothetical protein